MSKGSVTRRRQLPVRVLQQPPNKVITSGTRNQPSRKSPRHQVEEEVIRFPMIPGARGVDCCTQTPATNGDYDWLADDRDMHVELTANNETTIITTKCTPTKDKYAFDDEDEDLPQQRTRMASRCAQKQMYTYTQKEQRVNHSPPSPSVSCTLHHIDLLSDDSAGCSKRDIGCLVKRLVHFVPLDLPVVMHDKHVVSPHQHVTSVLSVNSGQLSEEEVKKNNQFYEDKELDEFIEIVYVDLSDEKDGELCSLNEDSTSEDVKKEMSVGTDEELGSLNEDSFEKEVQKEMSVEKDGELISLNEDSTSEDVQTEMSVEKDGELVSLNEDSFEKDVQKEISHEDSRHRDKNEAVNSEPALAIDLSFKTTTRAWEPSPDPFLKRDVLMSSTAKYASPTILAPPPVLQPSPSPSPLSLGKPLPAHVPHRHISGPPPLHPAAPYTPKKQEANTCEQVPLDLRQSSLLSPRDLGMMSSFLHTWNMQFAKTACTPPVENFTTTPTVTCAPVPIRLPPIPDIPPAPKFTSLPDPPPYTDKTLKPTSEYQPQYTRPITATRPNVSLNQSANTNMTTRNTVHDRHNIITTTTMPSHNVIRDNDSTITSPVHTACGYSKQLSTQCFCHHPWMCSQSALTQAKYQPKLGPLPPPVIATGAFKLSPKLAAYEKSLKQNLQQGQMATEQKHGNTALETSSKHITTLNRSSSGRRKKNSSISKLSFDISPVKTISSNFPGREAGNALQSDCSHSLGSRKNDRLCSVALDLNDPKCAETSKSLLIGKRQGAMNEEVIETKIVRREFGEDFTDNIARDIPDDCVIVSIEPVNTYFQKLDDQKKMEKADKDSVSQAKIIKPVLDKGKKARAVVKKDCQQNDSTVVHLKQGVANTSQMESNNGNLNLSHIPHGGNPKLVKNKVNGNAAPSVMLNPYRGKRSSLRGGRSIYNQVVRSKAVQIPDHQNCMRPAKSRPIIFANSRPFNPANSRSFNPSHSTGRMGVVPSVRFSSVGNSQAAVTVVRPALSPNLRFPHVLATTARQDQFAANAKKN